MPPLDLLLHTSNTNNLHKSSTQSFEHTQPTEHLYKKIKSSAKLNPLQTMQQEKNATQTDTTTSSLLTSLIGNPNPDAQPKTRIFNSKESPNFHKDLYHLQ